MRRQTRSAMGLMAPFVLFFAAFFVGPIGYAIYQSLFVQRRTGLLGLGGTTKTVFAGLDNYATALSDVAFVASLERILLFDAVQVPLMIILAAVLALLLDAASARGVRFFRVAYFLPYGVPGVIASILWGFLYVPGVSPIVDLLGHLGLHPDFLGQGALWSIANIVTWEFAGYNMLILIAQLNSIPGDLYEQAAIDGASGWQVVRHVKIPMIRPAIVLTTVFTIIGSLQLFAEPLVLRPNSNSISFDYTPNLAAYNAAFNNNDYNLAAAEAVLLALVTCVLSFTFLRLVGGLRGQRRPRR